MSKRARRGVMWVVAVGAVLAAGCMPPTRVEFIEKLSLANRKIARSTRGFRSALEPLTSGQAANSGQVHSAYDEMQKTLKEVKGDMAGQMLPPSSNSAKDFLTAYKEYLDAEQAILDGPMKQIVDNIDDGSLSIDDHRVFIWGNDVKQHSDGALAAVAGQDRAAFSKLTAAQQAYTSEHNYQPYGLADYIANEKAGK